MPFTSTASPFWPFKSAVLRDADTLVARWGAGAYEYAARMSAQEDIGLARTSHPGHWWRVQREVGRRFNRQDAERDVPFRTFDDRPKVDIVSLALHG